MAKCSFSGKELPPGKGIMYVRVDGKVLYFYDRKCEKNMIKLGRKAQNVGWTSEAKRAKQERMVALKHHAKSEPKVSKKE